MRLMSFKDDYCIYQNTVLHKVIDDINYSYSKG